MIAVPEADRVLAQHAFSLGGEDVPLHAAAGRVLRESVAADRDYPPFDRVTMDGIAIAHAAIARGRRASASRPSSAPASRGGRSRTPTSASRS